MTRRTTTLLCLPVAVAGIAFGVHAHVRVRALEGELGALAAAGKSAGDSFVSTLQGEHAERQRAAFDRRREVALALAAARRDRILGGLGVAGAALLAGALRVFSRISAEIEADRRHLAEQGAIRRPDRS